MSVTRDVDLPVMFPSAVSGSARTTVVLVNLNRLNDNFGPGGARPSRGAGAPYLVGSPTDMMVSWDQTQFLGDDMDSYKDCDCGYEDCACGATNDFDPWDYEEWCDQNDDEDAEGYWLADRLHEDGGLVYFRDAFGWGRC